MHVGCKKIATFYSATITKVFQLEKPLDEAYELPKENKQILIPAGFNWTKTVSPVTIPTG